MSTDLSAGLSTEARRTKVEALAKVDYTDLSTEARRAKADCTDLSAEAWAKVDSNSENGDWQSKRSAGACTRFPRQLMVNK